MHVRVVMLAVQTNLPGSAFFASTVVPCFDPVPVRDVRPKPMDRNRGLGYNMPLRVLLIWSAHFSHHSGCSYKQLSEVLNLRLG